MISIFEYNDFYVYLSSTFGEAKKSLFGEMSTYIDDLELDDITLETLYDDGSGKFRTYITEVQVPNTLIKMKQLKEIRLLRRNDKT